MKQKVYQRQQRLQFFCRAPEFNDDWEEFEFHLETFERWLAANDVANTKKSDRLVSILPANTYAFLRTLHSTKAVTECTYEYTTPVLCMHFKPRPIVIS